MWTFESLLSPFIIDKGRKLIGRITMKNRDGKGPGLVIPNPQLAMKAALVSTQLTETMDHLFCAHPDLFQVCLNLASHFLRIVPAQDSNSPLLDRCYLSAVAAIGKSSVDDAGIAFIKGLLSDAPEAMYWSLLISRRFNGPLAWDCVDSGLTDWITLHLRDPEVIYRHELQEPIIAPCDYREVLAYKLVPGRFIMRNRARFHRTYAPDTLRD